MKWLAVGLYAVRRPDFDAVTDGAVYGAVAGLGFATIENVLYVVQGFLQAQANGGGAQALQAAVGTGVSRALAGPGHVIYSARAGYYLGPAKQNPDNCGPIVVKGLLVASLIHGSYNVIVTYLPRGVSSGRFILFVVLFDGVFFSLLYRKLARYRDVYGDVVEPTEGDGEPGGDDATEPGGEATEAPAGGEGDEPTSGAQTDTPAAENVVDDEPTER